MSDDKFDLVEFMRAIHGPRPLRPGYRDPGQVSDYDEFGNAEFDQACPRCGHPRITYVGQWDTFMCELDACSWVEGGPLVGPDAGKAEPLERARLRESGGGPTAAA
jgi:hypothetical protein